MHWRRSGDGRCLRSGVEGAPAEHSGPWTTTWATVLTMSSSVAVSGIPPFRRPGEVADDRHPGSVCVQSLQDVAAQCLVVGQRVRHDAVPTEWFPWVLAGHRRRYVRVPSREGPSPGERRVRCLPTTTTARGVSSRESTSWMAEPVGRRRRPCRTVVIRGAFLGVSTFTAAARIRSRRADSWTQPSRSQPLRRADLP